MIIENELNEIIKKYYKKEYNFSETYDLLEDYLFKKYGEDFSIYFENDGVSIIIYKENIRYKIIFEEIL